MVAAVVVVGCLRQGGRPVGVVVGERPAFRIGRQINLGSSNRLPFVDGDQIGDA